MKTGLEGIDQIRELLQQYITLWIDKEHAATTDAAQLRKVAAYYQKKDDWKRSFRWYERAAISGCSQSQLTLALCYCRGRGVQESVDDAAWWLRQAAKDDKLIEAKRALKMFNVYGIGAIRLMNGPKMPQPYELNENDWKAAVEEKQEVDTIILYGMHRIISTLDTGKTPKLNEWLVKAAVLGYEDAEIVLGWCYTTIIRDFSKAQQWYSKSIKTSRKPYAHYFLALLYFEMKKYEHYSATMNIAATTYKFVPAQLHLSKSLLCDDFVKRNVKKGLELLNMAALCGSLEAMLSLGTWYRLEDGFTRDIERSLKWYHKAAEHGSADAEYWIAVLHGFKTTQGREQLQAAAESGSIFAQNDLGTVLALENKLIEARHWLKKAAANGDNTARENLKMLQQRMKSKKPNSVPVPSKNINIIGKKGNEPFMVTGFPLNRSEVSILEENMRVQYTEMI